MAERNYRGAYVATSHTCISVSDMSQGAFEMIDGIAAARNVSRSRVTRALIEGLVEKSGAVEQILGEKLTMPKARGRRHKVLRRPQMAKAAPSGRAQDSVCRELHGVIPVGGCRYPNCSCKV